ncbi:MAG: hypothetical protein RSD95_11290, partial [Clostridia bacterium]
MQDHFAEALGIESRYTKNLFEDITYRISGNVVTQDTNARTGTLTSVTDPTGTTVNYAYDTSKRITGVQSTANGKTYRNAYEYKKNGVNTDRLEKVSHNTASDSATDVTYTFEYDNMGAQTTVKVGTQPLSTNVYSADRSHRLNEVQYGNGGKVRYAYDDFDRLTGVSY